MFQSNGWETIQKQLSINDTGIIKVTDSSIFYILDLTKQLIATLISASLIFLMLWLAFNINLFIASCIVLLISSFIWILIIINGRTIISTTLDEIKNHLK